MITTSALSSVKNPAPRVRQQTGQNDLEPGNADRTRRLGVQCRGRTNRGLVPPLPPHFAKQSRSRGFASKLQGPSFGLRDSLRVGPSQPVTANRLRKLVGLDHTAHHQPLVHERRLASVCALLFCGKRLPFVLWLGVTRVDTTDPRGQKRGSWLGGVAGNVERLVTRLRASVVRGWRLNTVRRWLFRR